MCSVVPAKIIKLRGIDSYIGLINHANFYLMYAKYRPEIYSIIHKNYNWQ